MNKFILFQRKHPECEWWCSNGGRNDDYSAYVAMTQTFINISRNNSDSPNSPYVNMTSRCGTGWSRQERMTLNRNVGTKTYPMAIWIAPFHRTHRFYTVAPLSRTPRFRPHCTVSAHRTFEPMCLHDRIIKHLWTTKSQTGEITHFTTNEKTTNFQRLKPRFESEYFSEHSTVDGFFTRSCIRGFILFFAWR